MGENFMIGVPKGVGPLKMKEKIRFVLEFRKFLLLSFYGGPYIPPTYIKTVNEK